MPITAITTNGTTQIKSDTGYIRNLSVPNAGSAWTLQIKAGPKPDGTFQTVFGSVAGGTITTGLITIQPIYCPWGIQIVTAGTTPGELDIDWI
jgi:hypothetical protein